MILVVSYREEEHTAGVIQCLERQGREVLLVDLADFPAHSGLKLSWPADEKSSYLVQGPGGATDLVRARVGWWRRVRPFSIDAAIVSPSMRAFAESETSQAVGGMLDALPCVWVNNRAADEAAHRKPYQWEVAREVGLRLPRTLVTNQPEAARAFIREVGIGRTIFKAFLASIEAWRETRLVEQEDVEKLDLVRYAPVIFQEYVEGVDLRITVVGNQIFAAEIDARKTSYPVDMRMVIGEAELRPVKLPLKVHNTLLKLQRRLGLSYGAIDVRRTPDGEYIFLEVNPAGQWLFVEQRAGLPISQAVADHLAGLEDRTEKKGGAR
jgi:glutathione synthase/RimK-type ligase-like ATP-grasp enzyme